MDKAEETGAKVNQKLDQAERVKQQADEAKKKVDKILKPTIRRMGTVMERGNPAFRIGLNQIGIERMIVGVQQKGSVGATCKVALPNSIQIDVYQSIAIEHQEVLGQFVQRCQHCASRAQRFLFDPVRDADVPATAIAKMALNDFGLVAGKDADVVEAVLVS